jgi:hypothetical protein
MALMVKVQIFSIMATIMQMPTATQLMMAVKESNTMALMDTVWMSMTTAMPRNVKMELTVMPVMALLSLAATTVIVMVHVRSGER